MAELKFKTITVGYEPKRHNRFVVELPEQFGIESFLTQTTTMPNMVGDKWADFEISFIDIIEPSTTKGIMDMIEFCKSNKSSKFLRWLNKKELFSFSIKLLDPTGVEVEKWDVSVKELISVNFGDCDYGSDKLQIIKIVLRPIDCVLR